MSDSLNAEDTLISGESGILLDMSQVSEQCESMDQFKELLLGISIYLFIMIHVKSIANSQLW